MWQCHLKVSTYHYCESYEHQSLPRVVSILLRKRNHLHFVAGPDGTVELPSVHFDHMCPLPLVYALLFIQF